MCTELIDQPVNQDLLEFVQAREYIDVSRGSGGLHAFKYEETFAEMACSMERSRHTEYGVRDQR